MKKFILRGVLCLLSASAFLLITNCASSDKATSSKDSAATEAQDPLQEAIAAHDLREKANVERDVYRHPYETLKFFDVQPNMQVVEISPGKGWYTEILGPYLNKGGGKLFLAIPAADTKVEYFIKGNEYLKEKLKNNAEAYGDVEFTTFEMPNKIGPIAPKESVDRVLTFRNVHNWTKSGKTPAAFKEFFNALKPGGILGVVDHRAKEEGKTSADSGYVKQSEVIRMAEAAGFKLIEASEINANPKDTANHPKGVWTLPPSLALGDKDKEKYLEIGESDRMTLKFQKPEAVSKTK